MRRKMNMHQILTEHWPKMPQHEVNESCERVWKRIQEDLKKSDMSLRSLYGDGWTAPPTTQRQFQILTAIWQLGNRSDIHAITQAVEEWSGRHAMVGKVYAALHGLE